MHCPSAVFPCWHDPGTFTPGALSVLGEWLQGDLSAEWWLETARRGSSAWRGRVLSSESLSQGLRRQQRDPQRWGSDWVLTWSTAKPLFFWSYKAAHSGAFAFQLGLRSLPSCSISPKSAARRVSISALWVWWPSVPITRNASCQGNSTFAQARRRKKKKVVPKVNWNQTETTWLLLGELTPAPFPSPFPPRGVRADPTQCTFWFLYNLPLLDPGLISLSSWLKQQPMRIFAFNGQTGSFFSAALNVCAMGIFTFTDAIVSPGMILKNQIIITGITRGENRATESVGYWVTSENSWFLEPV